MDFSESAMGLTGQFIAAVLQTAGLFGQAQILISFQQIFHYLGALLFIVSGLGAIISVALFGSYKKAAYLFLAPGLFWWMVTGTQPVSAVLLQNGDRVLQTDQDRLMAQMKQLYPDRFPDGATKPWDTNVSSLFVAYDQLVSGVVQHVVSLILDTTNNADYRLAARERLMSFIFSNKSADPNYLKLIATSLGTFCQPQLYQEQRLKTPGLDAAEKTKIENYLTSLRRRTFPLPAATADYVNRYGFPKEENVTCDRVWQYAQTVSARQADKFRDEVTNMSEGPEKEAAKKAVADLDAVLAKTGSIVGAQASQVLAAWYLKNTLKSGPIMGEFANQLEGRMSFDKLRKEVVFGPVQQLAEAENGRFTIAKFASAVYLIQGFLLYILSCAFPFFALLLLLPSRAMGFVMWATLWLWVKSWDVGFAIVAFLRDMFQYFLPHLMVGGGTAVTELNINWDDKGSILNYVYTSDPTAGRGTYYTLSSLLTLMVPLVTAHLCLGATHLYNVVRGGLESTPQKFGKDAVRGARNRPMASLVNAQNLIAFTGMMNATNDTLARTGLKTPSGQDVDKTGRPYKAWIATGAAQQARWDTNMNPANQAANEVLSGWTGRRSTHSRGKGTGLVNKAIQQRLVDMFDLGEPSSIGPVKIPQNNNSILLSTADDLFGTNYVSSTPGIGTVPDNGVGVDFGSTGGEGSEDPGDR